MESTHRSRLDKHKLVFVIITILFCSMIIALIVGKYNTVQFASTTASTYYVDGTQTLGDTSPLILMSYDGRTLIAYVNFSTIGSPPGILYNFSWYNGTNWNMLTPIIRSNSYEWRFSGDWSLITQVRLDALHDTVYDTQRLLLAGSVRQLTSIGV